MEGFWSHYITSPQAQNQLEEEVTQWMEINRGKILEINGNPCKINYASICTSQPILTATTYEFWYNLRLDLLDLVTNKQVDQVTNIEKLRKIVGKEPTEFIKVLF